MRVVIVLVSCALVLAGCATPRERCLAAANADLRAVDAEIAERRDVIERAYRIQPARDARTVLHICAWPREPVLFCTTHTPARAETRVRVDLAQEERALEALLARRDRIAEHASAQAARCPV